MSRIASNLALILSKPLPKTSVFLSTELIKSLIAPSISPWLILGINVAMYFDNEEIGSSTKQGADSNMLLNILERICISLGKLIANIFK